jgi:AcrR family transcriptional regulator
LTVRAVAERAGVNERTVYRYFGSERGLRDAVMHRHEQEAGIDLVGMQLEDIAKVAAQIFGHVSSYPRDPRPPLDPTLVDANQRQREALLGAIAGRAEEWPDEDRAVVAAVLDVLWSVASYERLVVDWEIDHERAVQGISWVIGLVEEAVRDGRGPT